MRTLALRLLTFLFLALTLVAGVHAEALELRDAEFIGDASVEPPSDVAAWRPQALPDAWRANHPDAGDSGWYRFRFTMPDSHDPLQAVYLPRLGLNAAVFINGKQIGDGGSFDEPIARNWNRPLLFLIPPGLARAGLNTLHVHLRSHAYTQAYLHPLFIGAEKALRTEFESTEFLNITVNQTASLLITSVGILMLSLWWRRRQDVAYAYFGLAALVWAAQSTNLYLRVAPVPTMQWEIMVQGSVQIFSSLLLISMLRYAAVGSGPLIPALWFSAVAGPVSVALAPDRLFMGLTAFWHLYTLVAAAVTLIYLLRAALIRHNRDAGMLVAALALVFVLAGHDWLLHIQNLWDVQRFWPISNLYLLHYSAPFVFLSIGFVMTSRFVRVLNQFEALNNDLEARIQAKQAELQAGFARMHELETARMVTAERERIYSDLHDDVGAKLLSLVYRAATPDDANLARAALQDLRDVVSRTGADSYALEDLAADWRVECEQRLSEAGIALDWQPLGPLADLYLSQPQALSVGRILREAISNAIRHAKARSVVLRISFGDDRLRLEIADDGIGCADGRLHRPGRGLLNMEARARQLGGELTRCDAQPKGCIIALDFPISTSANTRNLKGNAVGFHGLSPEGGITSVAG